jgi:IclR family pca regulon transcriptional regulator
VGSARVSPSYRIEALAKGLRIMSLFSSARPRLRVKELADLTGYPMPTVFRLVATLEEEGYLERTPDGGVRPGIGALSLGFAALQGQDLVQVAEPLLRQLAEETGETVNLGVLIGDQVLIVARAQGSPTSLAANIRPGSRVPAVYSSIGKVLLAELSSEELAARLTKESFTAEWGPKAVRSLPALAAQLEGARADGFLVQEEEAIPGLSSLAAPIRELGGTTVAGLNVAVPSGRYGRSRLVAALRDPVLQTCFAISRRLGG